MMGQRRFTEELNRLINRAIAGGLPQATIQTVLTAQETALAAITSPVLSHDRTIRDPGKALNPTQYPRTSP